MAQALKMAADAAPGTILLANLSGRGDKDLDQVQAIPRLRALVNPAPAAGPLGR